MEKITNVNRYLVVNMRINISSEFGEYRGVFDSRVEDVRANDILVTIPTERGIPMPLKPGLQVEMSFIAEGGRFIFKSKVLGRVKMNIPLLSMEKPDHLVRTELREFFRVDTRLKIKLIITRPNPDDPMEVIKEVHDAICTDLSGGGCRIRTDDFEIERGDKVELDFMNTVDGVYNLMGKAVRIFDQIKDETGEVKKDLGIVFTNLHDSDRDKVIKYVFKRQIELRKLLKG